MKDLIDGELRMMELEERLLPIAKQPVDITVPNWIGLLQQSPHPLDEAGVRADAEALLEEVIIEYQNCPPNTRQAIRKLFDTYRSFSWAATLPYAPTTEASFLRHLVLFSIKDQGTDTRDAILLLQDLCRTAAAIGVGAASILEQVAALSSDENKFGMGSTKRLLLNAKRGSGPPPADPGR